MNINECDYNKNLSEKMIKICEENPEGVNNEIFEKEFTNLDAQARVKLINILLAQNKIEILKKGETLLYKIKKFDKAKNNEEKVVFSIIENAGNKGIWTKDIRFKSNISMITLNKVLKQMESKKLIKSVKSVNASKKKLYMLYEIEPDISITGGTWYSNQDFEVEFVEILNQQCYRYLLEKRIESVKNHKNLLEKRKNSFATSKEVCDFIKNLGISKVELTISDIEAILDTLIYDGKIESYQSFEKNDTDNKVKKFYRSLTENLDFLSNGLMKAPCGGCTLIKDCHKGGIISPETCFYLNKWLEN